MHGVVLCDVQYSVSVIDLVDVSTETGVSVVDIVVDAVVVSAVAMLQSPTE